MIETFSKVKVVNNKNKILNDSMKDWIEDHKDQVFKIERILGEAVKLYKVDFWLTIDLLEEV